MRKVFTLSLLWLACVSVAGAREINGSEADRRISGAEKILEGTKSDIPEFIRFRSDVNIPLSEFEAWAREHLSLPEGYGFRLLRSETDAIGMTHYRYQQTYNGLDLEGTMFIVHVRGARIESVNGVLFNTLSVSRSASLPETTALDKALGYFGASVYRWQIPVREAQLKEVTGNASATWFPAGTLVLAPEKGRMSGESYRLAWRFDIYSEAPMRREYVFVDANTGEVIYTVNRIRHGDVTGTAVTRYSGNRNITTDSVNATTYRLRETGRGLGIETYNLQTGTTPTNIDFTDTDNFWNNVNAAQDEVATDAHWGAEVTYDFLQIKFGRNSIDGAGQKLISNVHFDDDLVNANWDGTAMNYGDGDISQGIGPLTCLDITGHEICHGLTENTSNLNYQDESGALNESFSDCMGNSIRQFGKNNAVMNWLIGDEMGGTPFRDMSNPGAYGQPDTYLGNDWYTGPFDNGGVHTNSGVMNFWFYLLTEGGSGINDNSDAYNIAGLGLDSATAICYRMNTVYLTPSSEYDDARYFAIQAANDLYNSCSNAAIQTTNAWHAVGVGPMFDSTVSVSIMAPQTVYCTAPAQVQFHSTSNNVQTYVWNYGDGSPLDTTTSNIVNHTYTGYGQFDVTVIGDGGACGGLDTATMVQYISVDTLNPCVIWLPATGNAQTQTTCQGILYDNGGPLGNYNDQEDITITIAPLGAASVTINFTLFDLEDNFDYMYIYDGPNTSSPQFGQFTGNNLPLGGTIISSGGAITLRMTTDQALNLQGFALNWQCALSTVPPVSNFSADNTVSCTGVINFTDMTTQGPTGWTWDFGDGNGSTQQHPQHVYTSSGTYTVSLMTTNVNGSDTLTQLNYITINLPTNPTAADDSACAGSSAALAATGANTLTWYNVASGGFPLATGPVFNTPPVTVPTTYYVANEIPQAPVHVGPLNNNIGGGSNYTPNQYRNVIFNCYAPVRLVSVLVYATGGGNRTIQLRQNGNTIQSATINIPNGMSRITLNFDLPVDNDLELGAAGGVNLYRNSDGANYPYILNGIVSLTGNNADPDRYYFFYDWELQEPACASPRIPVNVGVIAAPSAAFTVTTALDTGTFTDQSLNATSWAWDFGDPASGINNTSALQNPTHIFSDTGFFNVCLVATLGSCTDTICQMVLINPTGIQPLTPMTGIAVYPNPVSNELVISFSSPVASSSWKAAITDVLGKTVSERHLAGETLAGPVRWDVSRLAPGAYFLTLESNGQKFVKKIIRQ